ncbi:M28 family metallopeptidase [Maribellus maritimus]|uniref:M28 family metallopeptidase n=1 Tax=Maribellus maritimus TaxID=2870838 RepID=UPI001EEB208A|nr:M28 family metallopeptidase [Maribellus maritimus]MCG6191342.1 M28 family peptidase [Maribellus maritimus]
MRKNILLLLVLIFIFACKQEVKNNGESAILYKNIEKHVAELASDKYKGRAPMSDAEPLVLDYLSTQMKQIGLEGANKGSYFQEVPILNITSKLSDALDFDTPTGKQSFNKLNEYVAFSQKVEEEMSLQNSEVIFAGFGITAPEFDRDDFAGADVKGKTIIVFVNDPGYGTSDDYFKGNTMTYYGRWTYKFEEAARRGAKACFIVHETGPAGYPWGVVRNNGETTKLFLDSEDGYKDRCSFEGWITKESAEKLFKACGYNFDELKQKAISKDFKPFELNAKASAKITSTFKKGTSKNVCGLIKGTTNPEEVVVYTAHWDHLGVGTPVNGDSIYNGATDNASAVSWMLEIARAFKSGKQPERSLLFLAVTSEESGLLGSGYYAENPLFPMNKTVACINTDVILFIGKFKDVTVTGYGHSELDNLLAEEAKKQGRYIAQDPNPENGMFFRSDHFPFMKKGVPAIFAKGYIEAENYGKEKTLELISDYWENTYHKPTDEYYADIADLNGLVQDAKLFYNVGLRLANSVAWPRWNNGSEFKAVRERSLKHH